MSLSAENIKLPWFFLHFKLSNTLWYVLNTKLWFTCRTSDITKTHGEYCNSAPWKCSSSSLLRWWLLVHATLLFLYLKQQCLTLIARTPRAIFRNMLLKTAARLDCITALNVIYWDLKIALPCFAGYTGEYIAADMFALENITSSGSLGKKGKKEKKTMENSQTHVDT